MRLLPDPQAVERAWDHAVMHYSGEIPLAIPGVTLYPTAETIAHNIGIAIQEGKLITLENNVLLDKYETSLLVIEERYFAKDLLDSMAYQASKLLAWLGFHDAITLRGEYVKKYDREPKVVTKIYRTTRLFNPEDAAYGPRVTPKLPKTKTHATTYTSRPNFGPTI